MGDPSVPAHPRSGKDEILRDADTFLHHLRRLRLGPVEHQVAPRIHLVSGAWTPWWRHDAWAFDLVEGGNPEVEVMGADGRITRWERGPGQWHAYPPGCAYRERYRKPTAVREWMWFMVGDGLVLPRKTADCLVIQDGEGRLAAYVRAMYAHQQRGGVAGDIALHGLYAAALGEILAAVGAAGDGTPARPFHLVAAAGAGDLLARLDEQVGLRLDDPPRVADLAERLGMSASSLAHRLRDEAGVTVVGRIRWLRLREARRLLAEGLSSKQVTRRLGFSSESYFARVFRAVVGMAPEAYALYSRRAGR